MARARNEQEAESYREYSRRYYKLHRLQVLKQKRLVRQQNPDIFRLRDKKHREQNSEYYRLYKHRPDERAKNLIRNATVRKLGRPKECVKCSCKQNLQWHHYKYRIETVTALCRRCHMEKHMEGKDYGRRKSETRARI